MSKGANQIGWFGKGGPVTPTELTNAYKFGQFYVPAGAMTPSAGLPSILTTKTTTGGLDHHTHTVMEFPHTSKSGCSFDWAFKSDFPEDTDPLLRLRVGHLFFSSSADSPNNIVRMDIGAVNLVMGDDINVGPNNETIILSTVQPTTTPGGEELLNGGNAASKQNVQLTFLNDLVGTPISATDWNFLTINIEREALEAADTFLDSVFLFGVGVQFAVNFNNVAEWPGT